MGCGRPPVTLVPFPPPPSSNDYLPLNVQLAKGDRRRWFYVAELPQWPGQPLYYKGFIKYDGRTHRGVTSTALIDISHFKLQCEEEIREHLLDGWVPIDAPQLRRFGPPTNRTRPRRPRAPSRS